VYHSSLPSLSPSSRALQSASIIMSEISLQNPSCRLFQIIPFEDCEALKQHFMHSMKQALFLESGSSKVGSSFLFVLIHTCDEVGTHPFLLLLNYVHGAKVAMSLSRSEQDAIWEAVVSSNKELFFPRTTEELKCIPVRVYEDGKGATTLHLSAASNVTIAGCMSVYNKTSTQGASTTNLFQCYYVQGIKVQEDTCLKWLWSTMRHADNFLYIVLAK
jgi:hypothetical protein